jgi:hypothetical protein
MTEILDTVAEEVSHFTPSNSTEYLALQFARKLSNTDKLRQYLVLFEHYPEEVLLSAFRRCKDSETLDGESFLRHFRELTMQTS